MKAIALLVAAVSVATAQQIDWKTQVKNRPISTGTAAPSASACNASSKLNTYYLRTGDPATIPTQLWQCVQTGASSYAWQRVSHKVQTAAPATCDVGDVWFDSDATAGQNWFGCTSSNTWTLLSGGGGTTYVPGPSGAITINTTPDPDEIDIDTAILPRKAISETISGLWTFSLGSILTPMALPTCNAGNTGRIVSDTGDSNKFKFCDGSTWTTLGTSSGLSLTASPANISTYFGHAYGQANGNFTPTGNTVQYVAFTLPYQITIGRLSYWLGINNAATYARLGIYDSSGNRVLQTPALDVSTATGAKTATFTGVVLTPGLYYWASSVSDTTAKVYSASSQGVDALANDGTNPVYFTGANACDCTGGGTGLPATIGAKTPVTSLDVPYIVGKPD